MKAFIYDGSFEGLLSAIYDAYYASEKPDQIISQKEHEINFLYEELQITTDINKYKKVSNAIHSKISELAMEQIYFAYLSELPGISTKIYDYIRYGFKTGYEITNQHTVDIVKLVQDAARKTTIEKHLLTGLVRFKKVKGGIYYSSIKPDHNILALLAPHFQDRLSDQRWIIHDIKRGIAAIYDKHNWVIQVLYSNPLEAQAPFNADSIKEIDMDYENLWKLYYKHISIETRKNLKLQKQLMPARYWHYLPEKKIQQIKPKS